MVYKHRAHTNLLCPDSITQLKVPEKFQRKMEKIMFILITLVQQMFSIRHVSKQH